MASFLSTCTTCSISGSLGSHIVDRGAGEVKMSDGPAYDTNADSAVCGSGDYIMTRITILQSGISSTMVPAKALFTRTGRIFDGFFALFRSNRVSDPCQYEFPRITLIGNSFGTREGAKG